MAKTLPFTTLLIDRMAEATCPDVSLRPLPLATITSLRASGSVLPRVAAALGVPALPMPNESVIMVGGYCLWVRPDEWLVVQDGTPTDGRALALTLVSVIGPTEGAMIDTTGSLVSLELSGPRARDVLASCCPLDLDAHVFPVGRCAQSMIAKAPALLHLVSAEPTFRLHVRPSLAAYIVSWLTDAMIGA